MIVTNLNHAATYVSVNPRFAQLFEYVASHDLLAAPLGRIEIDGDKLFINNVESVLQHAEERKLEVHRRYIDVQIILQGTETMGWKPLENVEQFDGEFNEAKDCATAQEPCTAYVTLREGEMAIFFPEDAHAPLVGSGKVRKAIAKVAV